MASQTQPDTDLTKNQSLVFSALSDAGEPLGAYTILDKLRDKGLRAPLQVYRALDKLVELGLVHRLDSLNAFITCRQRQCASHEIVAFTICKTCGLVRELNDDSLPQLLTKLALQSGFALAGSTIELRGNCAACQPA